MAKPRRIRRSKKIASVKTGAGAVTWRFFDLIDEEMGDQADISLDGISRQEVVVEQNAESVQATREIASSQLKTADTLFY